ncbi:MAG: hypothetical protein V1712_03215 [Patescibacteria group bacterium]
MKLYATVESERTTKGQGGNKKLSVTFRVGPKDRRIIATAYLTPSPLHGDNYYALQLVDDENRLAAQIVVEAK